MTVQLAGESSAPVRARLRRIEGQAHALVTMHDAGRSSTELLDQIAAVRAALGGAGMAIIATEAAAAGEFGRTSGQGQVPDEQLDALLELVHRLVRCT